MLILRLMRLEDIDQVIEIDRLSFPLPWSERSYRFEITRNPSSWMFVLATRDDHAERPLCRLIGKGGSERIVGFSGFWLIAAEAHISTIATHPDWRGHKLGELLLWAMIREAIRHHAQMVTLEVRVSNTIAQNLYHKYNFEPTGIRKGYYHDNHEDALLMTLTPLDGACQERLRGLGQSLIEHVHFVDETITTEGEIWT